MRKALFLFLTLAALPLFAGAPLKGVDVKLGKAGEAARTVRSDAHGNFDFGVLPKGTYTLTVEPGETKADVVLITIGNGGAKPQSVTWDFQAKRTEKAAPIVIGANGKDPVKGTCATTVKSKSNISNN